MNDVFKKKVFCNVIFSVLLCFIMCGIGFFFGYKTNNKNTIETNITTEQLRLEIDTINSELEQRINDCDRFQRQLTTIDSELIIALDLSRQSGIVIQSIGDTISNIEHESENIVGILKQLRDNQLRIREYCTELQDRNNKLTEQLGRISESIIKQ